MGSNWLTLSFKLCAVGFFKEIRPSEPFTYEYLVGTWKNLTTNEVMEVVYPAGTYSYLAHLFIIFLITDICRYKLLIHVLGISGMITWSILAWCDGLTNIIIVEIFYGLFMATEVAYYTYIYAKVDKEHYQKVTAHTRAATLAGRSLCGCLAQFLVALDLMDYGELIYITVAAMAMATLCSLFLPPVKTSIYFHRVLDEKQNLPTKFVNAGKLMKSHFSDFILNKYIVKWSIWWSLATCGYLQVQSYMQALWHVIEDDQNKTFYNGAVEAILSILGFLGAMLAGVIKVNWKYKGDLLLAITSLISGFILLYTSQTKNILVSYVCYILFGCLYHFVVTIASSEIAKYIQEDSYGLVFGFNMFLALAFQSLMMEIVVTEDFGLKLSARDQYFVYGIFYICISVFYIFIGLINWFCTKR